MGIILGWHFCDGPKLRDGTPIEIGKTYSVTGPLVICDNGLHGSRRAIDALAYGPGGYACRVESWGEIIEHDDKYCSRYRRVIGAADADLVLHEYACCCAEVALLLADIINPCCWEAIEAKRAWMRGEIDDKELAAAARAAAAAATGAWAAARAAAAAATGAWAAATGAWAATAAAWAAAAAATGAAAVTGARAARAWEENELLESMLIDILKIKG
jgi:hypothetical protein